MVATGNYQFLNAKILIQNLSLELNTICWANSSWNEESVSEKKQRAKNCIFVNL